MDVKREIEKYTKQQNMTMREFAEVVPDVEAQHFMTCYKNDTISEKMTFQIAWVVPSVHKWAKRNIQGRIRSAAEARAKRNEYQRKRRSEERKAKLSARVPGLCAANPWAVWR